MTEVTVQEAVDALVRRVSQLEARENVIESESMQPAPRIDNGKFNANLLSVVPVYSGDNRENIRTFFSKLEEVATISQWSEEDKLRVVRLKLVDRALEFATTSEICSAATSYGELKAGLIDRYRSKTTARFHREMLSNIRIQQNEEIEVFADRITRINSCTYELTEDQAVNKVLRQEADMRALDAFLNGLKGEIGRLTRLQFPSTFQEAVRKAVSIQEADRRVPRVVESQKIFSGRHGGENASGVRKPDTHQRSVWHGTGQWQPIQGVKQEPRQSGPSQQECFRCHKKGHIARNCRVRLAHPNGTGVARTTNRAPQ